MKNSNSKKGEKQRELSHESRKDNSKEKVFNMSQRSQYYRK